ncbi:phosphomannomutase/phosphoglucomutase [Dyella sp. A6]|uniref:phosphomannomutase/phosphoglucomutase n=1 Tax=Dyella aluminiiresistens TaxID=3069105 RepID=UPI002E7A25FD|nr:phosphomannomutase/phosphoglucomutase [Dyella sp. A6]
MAMKPAQGRRSELDWRSLLPLALATLFLLGGLFCAWQTWLIADQGRAMAQARAAQSQAAKELAAELASERADVAKVLASVDPVMLQNSPAQAVTWLKQRLPQVLQLDLYSGSLNEVLHANYRQFGYAKAAQLMAAQDADGVPPMQTLFHGAHDRRMSLVMPLGSPDQPLAWAWIELPFAPLGHRFDTVRVPAGKLLLQQNSDGGPMLLSSRGYSSGEAETSSVTVPGSTLSIAIVPPGAYIVLPHTLWLAVLLSLLGLGGGIYLLKWRARMRASHARPDPLIEELVVPEPVIPSPKVKVATRPVATAKPPAVSPAEIDSSIFRAYDVRGVVGKTLTAEVARLLGQAIGAVMREKGLHEIVVGRDGRLSGPELAGALGEGLRSAGIDVIDIGAAPTPVVYFAAYRFNTGSCVAVTGSHNPPDYNGFKIVVGGETLSEDAIQDLYRRIVSGALEHGGDQGGLRHVDTVPEYIERIASDVQAERSLKVVVDCGNGIPGAVAPQVLESIGCEVLPLYCEVDGTFPNHHPDPSDPHNLEDLILAVKQSGADLGVAFDGDGDRLGVVTKDGEIIFPDRLLMLFARDVLSRQPGATIIYDVKCTGHLRGQVLDAGGSPLMWRTGHSLIKAKMRETGAELAGEMSGHFFFKERWYGFDDGIYAGARLLEIIAGDPEERTPEEIFATLPKGVSTPELKIEMSEGEHYRFIEQFKAKATFDDATLVTIDGVRADWADGWGLVRASNTTPVLVLRFDADSPEALKRIQHVFRTQLRAIDPKLKLPF